MAKQQIPPAAVLYLVSACLLPSLVSGARTVPIQLVVEGRVFCDTCRAGFETPSSTYLPGAKVRVECRSRSTAAMTCSMEGETDGNGTYRIPVGGDHEQEICESILVSSPESGCAKMVEGRKRARVFLTRNNGFASGITRFANALGFQKETPMSYAEFVKLYDD